MLRKLGPIAFAVTVFSTPAAAQIEVHIATPVIRFEAAPPLVVVQPGIQVVPNYEEEVFFSDGWYWSRSGPYWFRTRDYRGGWIRVEPRFVPVGLVRIPEGRYRHWKHERKEFRKEERRERKEWRREHGHGHGNGHGHHGRD